MTMAWEVTAEDIDTVLDAHDSEENAIDLFNDLNMGDRVEDAVLAYTDFNDQVTASLSEIEDILIEGKFIKGAKKFSKP